MTRITIPTRDEAPAASQPTLDKAGKVLGFVPNLHRVMATSPAVLNGWAALQASLSSTLDVQTRDAIALAVSEDNGCNYCLGAHSWISKHLAKIPFEEIQLNRQGHSSRPKIEAALVFAKKVLEMRGKVADGDLEAVRAAGYTDGQVLEIIALAVQFLFTNYINNAMKTEADFPVVDATPLGQPATKAEAANEL